MPHMTSVSPSQVDSLVEALRESDQGFGPGQQRADLFSAWRPTLLDLRSKLTTEEQGSGQGNTWAHMEGSSALSPINQSGRLWEGAEYAHEWVSPAR